jgi:hypothetical protein
MTKLNGALYLVRRLRERGNLLPPWWKLRGIVDREHAGRPDLREPGFPGQPAPPSIPATG